MWQKWTKSVKQVRYKCEKVLDSQQGRSLAAAPVSNWFHVGTAACSSCCRLAHTEHVQLIVEAYHWMYPARAARDRYRHWIYCVVTGVNRRHQLIASQALLPPRIQCQAETPSACEVCEQRLECLQDRGDCVAWQSCYTFTHDCIDCSDVNVGGSHLCCNCAQQVLASHPEEHSTLGMFSWSARRFLPLLAAGCVAS